MDNANVFDIDRSFVCGKNVLKFKRCCRPVDKLANDDAVVRHENRNAVAAANFRFLRQNQQCAVAIKRSKLIGVDIQCIEIVMPVGKAYPLPFVFSEVDADCLFAFKQARTFNIRNGVNDFVFVFVAGQSKNSSKLMLQTSMILFRLSNDGHLFFRQGGCVCFC